MKKTLKWIAVILLVLIITVPILIGKMMGPAAQAVLTEIISPALGVKVEAAKMDISVWGGSCTIDAFEVGNPEGFKTPHAFQFDKMKVDLDLWSLLGDVVRVQEIRIEGGETIFETGLKGSNLTALVANAMRVAENPSAALSGDAKPQDESKPAGGFKMPGFGKTEPSSESGSSGEAGSSEQSKPSDTSASSNTNTSEASTEGGASAAPATTGTTAATKPATPSKPIRVIIDSFVMTGCGVKVASALTLNKAVNVPMGEVEIKNLGEKEGGISPPVALAKIMGEVVKASTKAAMQKSGDMLKGAASDTGTAVKDAAANTGETVKEGAQKATEGIKKLLGK